MSTVQNGRRVSVAVKYQGKNITQALKDYLIDFKYTDSPSGEVDTITLNLDDRKRKWTKEWNPKNGDRLIAEISVADWDKAGHNAKINCGAFEVDSMDLTGPPHVAAINALSVPQSGSPAMREKRTKAWEKVKLRAIAQEVANRAKLKLMYSVKVNPTYERQDQTEESDFSFLSKICTDEGIAVKVSGSQLVLYDEAEHEKRQPAKTIEYGKSPVISYKFSESSSTTAYSSCVVTYKSTVTPAKKKKAKDKKKKGDKAAEPPIPLDPDLPTPKFAVAAAAGKAKEKGKTQVITGKYTIPGVTGPVLKINQKVDSVAEAQRLARNKLREQNKNAGVASLVVPGDVTLASGITVTVKGWGRYDGKYLIVKAEHSVGSNYTTSLEIRKVLGY
ncbi:late control protein [Paenibacillus xylanexedens]|uniref:phage late control D family protein n=1 Tax=Paenibacillus xylanexedens TaxID=528191 RepID=UPI001F2FAB19|nr:contractile injection system protein, VgrG/Pvc8 family [Paenibacillus xylanexedens]MCF7753377.1 late control protein [Paenibacillus xylanexedens]